MKGEGARASSPRVEGEPHTPTLVSAEVVMLSREDSPQPTCQGGIPSFSLGSPWGPVGPGNLLPQVKLGLHFPAASR